jgi:hypothetical protein
MDSWRRSSLLKGCKVSHHGRIRLQQIHYYSGDERKARNSKALIDPNLF